MTTVADLQTLHSVERRWWLQQQPPVDRAAIYADIRKQFGTPFALYQDDPVGFVEDVLHEYLWSRQRVISRSIRDHKRTVVPSCVGPGKTHLSGRLVAWWVAVHRPEDVKVVTTAKRWRQVKSQLWPHIRRVARNAGLPGRMNQTDWWIDDEQVAYGFAPDEYDESCFDDQTEILTDDGWKFFADLRGDEQVLTLNGDTAEWGPITQVHRYDFDGHLNLHDGGRVNFCITDNHRLLVRGATRDYRRHPKLTRAQADEIKHRRVDGERGRDLAAEFGVSAQTICDIVKGRRDGAFSHRTDGPRWQLTEYRDLPNEFWVRRTNTWRGDNPARMVLDMPRRPYRKAEHYDFDFADWCSFVGWFVAEGSTHQSRQGGSIVVDIAQQPGVKYEQIAALLDRMGIRYSRGRRSLRFSSDAIGGWVRDHCGHGASEKKVPRCVKDARPEMIRAFLDSFGLGDGSAHTHPGSRRYITSSPKLADDLMEMMVKLGTARKMRRMHAAGSVGEINGKRFTRNHDTFVLNEAGAPRDSTVRKDRVQRVPYTGKVYCVSTPHQTIMVRRKGCPMWSGNSVQGIHAPKLLIIVDEAGGILPLLGDGLNNLLTGDAHILAIGNPPTDDESSWFESICMSPQWNTVPIPADTTPNFTGETCPPEIAKQLISPEYVKDTAAQYGSDSAYYLAKIEAQFPKVFASKVIPFEWCENAMFNEHPSPSGWQRLGVDVASGGGDEMAVAHADGWQIAIVDTWAGADSANQVTNAERVLPHILAAQGRQKQLGYTERKVRVKVDGIGVGSGTADILERMGKDGLHDAEVVKVLVSEKATDDGKFHRRRDECWWTMREVVRDGTVRIDDDPKLRAQLCGPNWKTNASGKIEVESKVVMKRRGLPSPDRADAANLAVYEPSPVVETNVYDQLAHSNRELRLRPRYRT